MEENDKSSLLEKARDRLMEVGDESRGSRPKLLRPSKTEWLLPGGWPSAAVMPLKT